MRYLLYLFSLTFLLASCGQSSKPAEPSDKHAADSLKAVQKHQADSLFEVKWNKKVRSVAKNDFDSASFAIGVLAGVNAPLIEGTINKRFDVKFTLDDDLLLAGVKAVLDIQNDSTDLRKREKQKWAGEILDGFVLKQNKIKSAAFLVENAKNDSVKVLESGLQYKVLAEGTGASPEVTDSVRVVYVGKLINGNMFDSSRGDTVKFSLSKVVAGWRQGLPLMKEGAHYMLYVPASLGYGDIASRVPGGSTLIFDVKLIEVIKGKPAEPKEAKPAETK
jgi:FKBP-type peptidyl-prolyl cis-trans isomerase